MTILGKDKSYYIHSFIGIALMFVISNIPPMGPVTQFGMQLGGIFLGLIYLWSFVGTFWTSLFGVIMLGMVEEIGMYGIFSAFSSYIALLVLFCLILCGAIGDSGLTVYIGRWFLTRKIIDGRPTVFNFMIMVAFYVVAGLIDPLAAVLIMWPTMYGVLQTAGYTTKDKYPRVLTVCSYLAICFGQCMIPFWGGQLVMLGAFEGASGISVNYAMYLFFNVIMSLIMIALMSLAIQYIFRCDMEKMKAISVEKINKDKLPPLSIQQKIYIGAAIAFLVFAISSAMLPQDWGFVVWMNKLTLVGFTMFLIVMLVLIKIDGKPVLDAGKITKEYVSWDMYFLVVVTVFLSNTLLSDETGLKQLLIDGMMPVLGKVGAVFFLVLLIVIGILLTSYASNIVVGTVFVQLIAAIAPELGMNPVPVAMVCILSVFVAMLSPAASPYAPALHTNTEWTSSGEIMKYGLILMALAAVVYIVIGYPIATILF